MSLVLGVLSRTARQVGSHLGAAVVANVGAVLLSLPVVIVLSAVAGATSLSLLPLGVVLLLGVLPNPALVGLQLACRSFATGESMTIREQWEGLIQGWRLPFRAWLVGVAITALILLNVTFYPRMAGRGALHIVAGPIEVIWLSALVFWLAMHLYLYPLLLRQEPPSVLMAYRNAAVVALSRPGSTLLLTAAWIAWLTVTATTGPAYVIGLAVAATMQQNALSRVLPRFRVTTANGA